MQTQRHHVRGQEGFHVPSGNDGTFQTHDKWMQQHGNGNEKAMIFHQIHNSHIIGEEGTTKLQNPRSHATIEHAQGCGDPQHALQGFAKQVRSILWVKRCRQVGLRRLRQRIPKATKKEPQAHHDTVRRQGQDAKFGTPQRHGGITGNFGTNDKENGPHQFE